MSGLGLMVGELHKKEWVRGHKLPLNLTLFFSFIVQFRHYVPAILELRGLCVLICGQNLPASTEVSHYNLLCFDFVLFILFTLQ